MQTRSTANGRSDNSQKPEEQQPMMMLRREYKQTANSQRAAKRGIQKIWCAVLLGMLPWSASATALDVFLANIEQQTLQSDFIITITEEAAQPMNYPGTIVMQGNRFLLKMFDTEAAYDGETLYIYNISNDELTLTTPSEEELSEANPFLYAKALMKVCSAIERPTKDPTRVVIVLTPKDQTAGIQKFTLHLKRTNNDVRKEEYLPLSVEIKEGKQLTTLTLKQPKYTTEETIYRLNYPEAYLNDLR